MYVHILNLPQSMRHNSTCCNNSRNNNTAVYVCIKFQILFASFPYFFNLLYSKCQWKADALNCCCYILSTAVQQFILLLHVICRLPKVCLLKSISAATFTLSQLNNIYVFCLLKFFHLHHFFFCATKLYACANERGHTTETTSPLPLLGCPVPFCYFSASRPLTSL